MMENYNKKKGSNPKIAQIDLAKLVAGSMQPRTVFNDQKIAELAESIKMHGILQPLIVRSISTDRFEVIAGERRMRAAKVARMTKLPCLIMDMLDENALAVALVENVQREDLNPIEEAQAYFNLKETLKINQEDIALRVGKDRASIANILRLLKLPKPVQDMVINQELSMGHARALLSLDSSDMILMVAKKSIREGLSVRRIEGLIRSLKKGLSIFEQKKDPHSLEETPIERELRQRLEYQFGSKVELKKENQGYMLKINFLSTEQLNLMLERLGVEI